MRQTIEYENTVAYSICWSDKVDMVSIERE